MFNLGLADQVCFLHRHPVADLVCGVGYREFHTCTGLFRCIGALRAADHGEFIQIIVKKSDHNGVTGSFVPALVERILENMVQGCCHALQAHGIEAALNKITGQDRALHIIEKLN